MEFSAILHSCSSLSRWSPDGELLAAVHENVFQLRRIEDPAGGKLFATQQKVQQLCWAPNSQKLFVRFSTHLCVYSIEDPSSGFIIDEEMQPIVAGIWSPNSSFILTAADCNKPMALYVILLALRLSVWALSEEGYADETNRKLLVRRPKFPLSSGQAFSLSGDLWAVCTRTESKDFLEIFSTQTWRLYKSFSVKTQNLENFLWMPSGTSLLLWDSPLYASLFVYHISGDLLQCMQFSSSSLGIQDVSLHARSQTLLVQFFDQSIRVISAFDLKELHQRPLIHKRKISARKQLLILEEKKDERMHEQPFREKAPKPQNEHQQEFLQNQQKTLQASTTCGADDNKKEESGFSTVSETKGITRARERIFDDSFGAETPDLVTSTCYVPVDFSEDWEKTSLVRKKSMTGSSTTTQNRVKVNSSSTEDSTSSASEAEQKTDQLPHKFFYLPYQKKKTAAVGTGLGAAALESESQRNTKRGFLQFNMPSFLSEKKTKRQSQILRLRISPCGTFLATNCAPFPTAVFIWNLLEGKLRYILLHQQIVSSFTWNPHPAAFSDGSCLTICTNESKVFFWTPLWQSILQLPFQPAEFRCQNLRWSSRGEALLLQDKGRALIAYPSFLYMPASVEKEIK